MGVRDDYYGKAGLTHMHTRHTRHVPVNVPNNRLDVFRFR